MKLLNLLQRASDNLHKVEKIIDEIVGELEETHMGDCSLATELDYLAIQIGNVAESARDFKKHMVEVLH